MKFLASFQFLSFTSISCVIYLHPNLDFNKRKLTLRAENFKEWLRKKQKRLLK